MADVKMPKSIPCRFNTNGWAPQCKKPSDNGWCSQHEGLECRSCGEQAVKSCDAQMGGLGCGAPLCSTCEHGESGGHVTKQVAEENRRKEKEEREALIASRTSPVRRMNEEGVPANLFELLKGDWREDGYELRKVYFLELEHGLMGFFPAILSSDDKRIVFTDNLRLLEKVWQTLEPRKAKLREKTAYISESAGILFIDTESPKEREESVPRKLLTETEFHNLVSSEEEPFRWARGLSGGRISRQEDFLQHLATQASDLDPSFASAA